MIVIMKNIKTGTVSLDMEIERDRRSGKVSLTQKGYLQKILQRFNINGDTKSVSTPLAPHLKLKTTMSPTTVEEREYMTRLPYVSVGPKAHHSSFDDDQLIEL